MANAIKKLHDRVLGYALLRSHFLDDEFIEPIGDHATLRRSKRVPVSILTGAHEIVQRRDNALRILHCAKWRMDNLVKLDRYAEAADTANRLSAILRTISKQRITRTCKFD